jgi:hypothetical protein
MFPSIPYKMTLINKHASCQMVPLHRHRFLNHKNRKRQFNSRNLRDLIDNKIYFSRINIDWNSITNRFTILKARLKSK